MIITIDGPAGSGKSSTARALAARLGFRHLDSGAFYRALTLAALQAGIPADTWPTLSVRELDRLRVRGQPGPHGYRMFLGRDDVTDALRSPPVNDLVSSMARVPAVRGWLLNRLREAARDVDLVADGRDMGTVVFPGADVKIFLTCSLETRARRRLLEQGIPDPRPEELRAETSRLAERDRLDSQRPIAPLQPAADAVHLDTTDQSFEDQVAQVERLVRARSPGFA